MKYEVIHNIEFCAKPEQVCIPEALCAKAPFRACPELASGATGVRWLYLAWIASYF